ncbi:MAG TPA: TolC family protein [Gammaproteobacteria bacterium]|nr:TolC family protein [Gammaproteobacteria bacterium]
MLIFSKLKTGFVFIALSGFWTISQASQVIPLSLPEAEHLAISHSSELAAQCKNTQALHEDSIADGQLSDPQLMVGAVNVPDDGFSFRQDDMTMTEVGVQQSFPAGNSLIDKEHQTQALAEASEKHQADQSLMLVQNVRDTWLDLYYWEHAEKIIHKNRLLFMYVLKVSKSQYSAGKSSLNDVTQAQLELSRLDDQALDAKQQAETLRFQLGRWIGQDNMERPLVSALPSWSQPNDLNILQDSLQNHPLLKTDAADIEASRDDVKFNREQYKPTWTVGVYYGMRQGNMSDGTPRTNMATAQVMLSLPLFTHQRQGRRAKASIDRLEEAQLNQTSHYRDLQKELNSQYETWQLLTDRENLYSAKLIPEAKRSTKTALLGYRHATTDMAVTLKAYTNQLNVQLEQLQIKVARKKAEAALMYLSGTTE